MINRNERRHAPRTYSNVPVDLYDPFGRMIIGEARFVNISYTGSTLESQLPLRPGQPIRLQMQSPGRSPIDIAGHVVWKKKKVRSFMYGVQFDILVGDYVTPITTGMTASHHGQR